MARTRTRMACKCSNGTYPIHNGTYGYRCHSKRSGQYIRTPLKCSPVKLGSKKKRARKRRR